ncbi:MAG TPA: Hint domain-containing protein [Paracoccaceae bacterium]|nr:Hint domain-containing protein [Paracoccaceae bacterium]
MRVKDPKDDTAASNWIALRDTHGVVFSPFTRGHSPSPGTLLPRGTLFLHCAHEPRPVRHNLIRYSARAPWPCSLTVCTEPDGRMRVLMAQGASSTAFDLPTALRGPEEDVIFRYSWDGPARQASLTVDLPERGATFHAKVEAPIPLFLRDVHRIIAETSETVLSHEVRSVAFSAEVEPIGPNPTLAPDARIATPAGERLIASLKVGDYVLSTDGEPAQIRWVCWQDVPARGRFAPLRLRAPFYGLHNDLIVAPDQRLRLSGSEVEYLFAEEQVSATAGHLMDGRTIVRGPDTTIQRYYQLLLDRPATLIVNGAALESFDPGAMAGNRELIAASVLRGLPPELVPSSYGSGLPQLKGFEALTLAH